MGNREGRHMAPSGSQRRKSQSGRNNRQPASRREPLRDNYYYEESRQDQRRGGSTGFQDVSSYSSSKRRQEDRKELERQRKQGMSRGKKAVLIICAVFVLLIAGGLWYIFGYVLKDLNVRPINREKIAFGDDFSTPAGQEELPVVLDDSIKNIALFGVDNRGGGFTGRSDAIMVISVDNKHGKIKMISFLRDSCVDISGSYDKLAHAYAYGEDEGAELAINTLNRNFRLNIEDYVTVNFARMAEIVDACGGIDLELTAQEVQHINKNLWSLIVDVEEEIAIDKENGAYEKRSDYAFISDADIIANIYGNKNVDSADYEYEGGKYHLNGNQAVAYGRIRYIDSDDMRAVRQQNVLKALIQQIRGKSKLEYPEMIRKILPMCETSLDFGDMVGMLPILFTNFTMETMNIPGETEEPSGGYVRSDCWVYLYDLVAATKHIANFIYESDSPYYGEEIIPGDPGIPTVDGGYDEYVDVDQNASSPSSDVSSDPSSGDSSGLESGISSEPSGGDVSSEPGVSSEPWVEPSEPDVPDEGGEPEGDSGEGAGYVETGEVTE